MEDYSAALKLLLLISCVHLTSADLLDAVKTAKVQTKSKSGFYQSSSRPHLQTHPLNKTPDTHTLQYLYTAVTPGVTDFPEFTAVGLLDGEQFMFYSSDNRTLIIKDWIKKTNSETYWLRETQEMWGNQYTFNNTFTTIMEEFHHSEGVHTLQRMFGCDDDDDVTTRGYDQYGYDGEDFISLNLTTGTWTAVKPQAVNKHTWESKGSNKYWNFLESDCIDLLNHYLSHSNHTLDRKVRPEVSVFQKHSSPSPEMMCYTTGFFPKALNITWQKDGEDVHEDVELRETLPNQDGSFQKRSILKVPAEELQKHNYTCVVQHSSLEKELVREVPKGGGSGGALIAIITAVVAALVALVAVVVGVRSGRRRRRPLEQPLKEILPPTTWLNLEIGDTRRQDEDRV